MHDCAAVFHNFKILMRRPQPKTNGGTEICEIAMRLQVRQIALRVAKTPADDSARPQLNEQLESFAAFLRDNGALLSAEQARFWTVECRVFEFLKFLSRKHGHVWICVRNHPLWHRHGWHHLAWQRCSRRRFYNATNQQRNLRRRPTH